MRRALALAARGVGTTHPNPRVGAVLVRGGKVVGEGWHRAPGEPHAEALALAAAGPRARGGTLFVTLEPCAHHGRTPPCADALVEAGVARVVAAMNDPDPQVDGRGISRLRRAGVEVEVGLLGEEARELNRAYLWHRRTGLPWVTLKLALSLDGRLADPRGASRWITGERARACVHRLRAGHDAILVGVGTVLADDPLLTVRDGRRPSVPPLRVVLDPSLRTPPASRLLASLDQAPLLLVAGEGAPEGRVRRLRAAGAEVLILPRTRGTFAWPALGRALTARGVLSVLAEGGGRTAGWLLARGAVRRAELFYAPLFLGEGAVPAAGAPLPPLARALRGTITRTLHCGPDLRVTVDFPSQGKR